MAKKNSGIVSTDNPSQRPTMGNSASTLTNPSKPLKGMAVKKTGQEKGGFLEAATAAHRVNIQERLGAKLHPSTVLYKANAAEAGQVQRNVRLMPSAMGNRDFNGERRQFGQGA